MTQILIGWLCGDRAYPEVALKVKENTALSVVPLKGDKPPGLIEERSLGDRAQLGKIAARLEGSKQKEAPAKDETKTGTGIAPGKPKAPKTVAGRGNVVTRDERMKAAADANDFTAFRAASRARDKD